MGTPITTEAAHLILKLGGLVRAGKLTQTEIQARTGVHQSQVSRILSGKAKRTSPNVDALCKYAHTFAFAEPQPASVDANALQELVLKIWNGKNDHAQAIREVLLALDHLQRCVVSGT
jgi:transcriptional regulator with XRE-family HTH domain